MAGNGSSRARAGGDGRSTPRARLRLGRFLLDRGWISGEQLLRAVQSQRSVGGRLGTCLLEMDAVSEDRLLEALSKMLGVPAVRIEQMRGIESETLALVPRDLAVKYQAIPFASTPKELDIALLDVDNLARLDELAFAADKRVRPHIANEARLFEALERYYDVECPQRYGHLLDRLNRARYLWNDGSERHDSKPRDEDSDEWPTDLASKVRFVGPEEVFVALTTPDPPKVPEGDVDPEATVDIEPESELQVEALDDDTVPPLARPRSLEEVGAELAKLRDVETIADVLLDFLAGPFVRCALLRLSGGRLGGWRGFGPGFDLDRLRTFDVDPDAWRGLHGQATGSPHVLHGNLDHPATRALAACWDGAPKDDWWQLQVRLKGRLVSAILGHRESRPAPDKLIAQLAEVCEKTALAFEMCILGKKIQHASPPEPRS